MNADHTYINSQRDREAVFCKLHITPFQQYYGSDCSDRDLCSYEGQVTGFEEFRHQMITFGRYSAADPNNRQLSIEKIEYEKKSCSAEKVHKYKSLSKNLLNEALKELYPRVYEPGAMPLETKRIVLTLT